MAVEINDGKANKILTLWLRSQKDEQVPPKRHSGIIKDSA